MTSLSPWREGALDTTTKSALNLLVDSLLRVKGSNPFYDQQLYLYYSSSSLMNPERHDVLAVKITQICGEPLHLARALHRHVCSRANLAISQTLWIILSVQHGALFRDLWFHRQVCMLRMISVMTKMMMEMGFLLSLFFFSLFFFSTESRRGKEESSAHSRS